MDEQINELYTSAMVKKILQCILGNQVSGVRFHGRTNYYCFGVIDVYLCIFSIFWGFGEINKQINK